MKFAEKLKKAMQELNLNQRQVVTLTGKSKGSVSQYLSGKQIPSEDVQSAIATSLGLASDYFTGMDKELQVMPQLEIRDGVIPRLDVTKAAKLMGMNHNTVRTGGYLKVLDESESAQIWWDGLTDGSKDIIKSLPNFDAEIFRKCTGIKVESEDKSNE